MHIQVHSSNVLYAGKCTRRAGKYNLTKLEAEIMELIYPPSIHCTVRYPLPPDSSMETQEVDLVIKGTSLGQLRFPVKVTEVKGQYRGFSHLSTYEYTYVATCTVLYLYSF